MPTKITEAQVDDLKAVAKKLENLPYGDQKWIAGAIIALDAATRADPNPDADKAS